MTAMLTEPLTESPPALSPVPLGGLPPTAPAESAAVRRRYAVGAGFVALLFLGLAALFWVPAHPGVDQNGYLVGGKLFAATGSTGFQPENEFAFVGRMWVEVANGRCYPKYPLGLSVVFAAMLKLGGRFGVPLCFCVNPAAMTLGLLATFGLARRLVGSGVALLATVLIATSPVCVGLTDNPNSHATAFCCASAGVYLLVRWWQQAEPWAAAAAGLLLGTTVTLRYTEGLLVLPLLYVAATSARPRDPRWWVGAVLLGLGWAAPVAGLARYNWREMHHLTGYDPTNESTGFALSNVAENWETMLREMYNTGLFFTLPLAVVGTVALARRRAKVAGLLAAWAAPNLALYVAYYWAPDNASISYLRFTLTVFPALAVAIAWGAKQVADGLARTQGSRAAGVVAAGAIVAVGCGVNLYAAVGNARAEAVRNRATATTARNVLAAAPAGSTIFAPDNALNFLQLVGDYHMYDAQQFNLRAVQRYAKVDPNEPAGLQPQRAKEMYDRSKDDTEQKLIDKQNAVASKALAAGRRVFLLYPDREAGQFLRLATRRLFTTATVATWSEPAEAKKQRWAGVNRPNRPANEAAGAAWLLVELKPAPPPPPAPRPATKPAVRPATQPTKPRRTQPARPPATQPKR